MLKMPNKRYLFTQLCGITLLVSTFFFTSLFPSNSAFAAQQGDLASSSSGSVDLIYVQGLNARITGLADMALGTWNGVGPLTANENICIGRSGVGFFGTGSYRILAQGNGTSGDPSAFTLTNGVDEIFYNAFFNDAAGITGRTPLVGGTQLTGQTGGGFAMIFNLIFGCVFNNANISIEVPPLELSQGLGNYTGTLTLTLIPE